MPFECGESMRLLRDLTTQGPSTPQITAVAVICCGRDDRGPSSRNERAPQDYRVGGLTRIITGTLLLYGHRLRQIPGLVDVAATSHSNMVGQQL
jgi:hypothetical protein